MTLYDFKLLELRAQLDLLQQEGAYIGKQKEEQRSILLFQLDGFYVEIYYQKHRAHISGLRCFTSTLHIESYLDQVAIDQSVTY